jgi:hypothetical protein
MIKKITVVKPDPDFNCIMTLTPFMYKQLLQIIPMELAAGVLTELPDDMVEVKCNLSDEKMKKLKQAIHSTFFGEQINN